MSPTPSPTPPARRRRRRWAWFLGTFVVLLIAASIAAVVIVRSEWFANKVRERIVAEVEKASGGRTEIGSFHFDWGRMRATVTDFVLHGTEGPAEAPLFGAKRVEVGLGITSVFRAGIHVRSIQIDQPTVHIIADKNGKTNFPEPKVKSSNKDALDTLLDLGASEIGVHHGSFDFNELRMPLELVAHDVDVHLLYNSNRLKPKYFGDVSANTLTLEALKFAPVTFAYNSTFVIEHGTIAISQAKLATKESKIEVSGFAYQLSNPVSDFGVNATISLAEFAGPLQLPIEHRGVVQFAGKVSLKLKDEFDYAIDGRLKGNGLAIREGSMTLRDAAIDTQISVTPKGLVMKRLMLAMLGGRFDGSAELADFKKVTVDGSIRNMATGKVLLASGQKPLPYISIARGPVHVQALLGPAGVTQAVVKTDLTLAGGVPENPQQIPLEGMVNVTWTQAANTIELRESHLATPSSSVDVSGTLGHRLDVVARTTRLGDIEVMLTEPLPIQLHDGGSASFDGTVSGPLENPQVDGRATLTNFVYDQQSIDNVSAEFSLTRERLSARSFTAAQGDLKLDGTGSAQLRDWQFSTKNPLTASVNLHNAKIEKLLAEVKQTQVPVTGSVSVSANVHGSIDELEGDANINASGITAWDEQLDRVQANVRISPQRVEIANGSALFHKALIPIQAVYQHKAGDWQAGTVSWNVKVPVLDASLVHNFATRFPEWKGSLSATLAGSGSISNGSTFRLTALNGDASVRSLAYQGRDLGSVDLNAATSGSDLKVTANAAVRSSRVRLNGDWKLTDGYPGGGDVSMTSVSFDTLRDLFIAGAHDPLPFQSAVEAGATFRVPLSDPNQLTAEVKIQRLFIAPGAQQRLGAGAKEQDLVLENTKPVIVHVTPGAADIETAVFHSTNTNIEVSGKVAFSPTAAFDLRVKGGLNLGQLQMFRQDLLASGTATMDATVHGSLTDPQVNGSLTLAKASLYFGDLPVGLDNVNGSVSFDRNRATIQSLAAESGGGRMGLTGFIGFGGPALIYRLQGDAHGVRVRYPEGASTTVNATVSLTGTSEESLLTGTVTIVRAAFTPRSDLGSLMSNLTKSTIAPIPQENDYILGMHLDVRIESEPNLEFQTSLTRGLQAEVDLRLRGTAARPTLLGDVSFSEGEISLFGNKYTLNRGDIRFFNPTRIEPVFDLEAQTRARGIDVNISFSGTASKLNVSYRSDPPLQPTDIIALLAIGRDPNISAGLAASQTTQPSAANGLGSVVGEAVASSVTNRLQKFFGVTKIKIDPQLTGLDNIPQARITLEQQVSNDVTMTFITNIARTSEQIVRIEWDLSKQWSALAIRDENGLFGIDIQYKRRFK
ncbi:MAG TPA: translocation/assembly module TamB domain-containing protein [Bryobacteraceae bacterium]|jgi:translocation and assembly module TamB